MAGGHRLGSEVLKDPRPFGRNGALAQLVAHLLCKQRVRGSSPLGSTIVMSRDIGLT